jgi:nucleoside diphosphate kinase
MTSGPVVVFLLVGKNCIERLNCLAGEMDPQVAKLKHPSSLRAIYGKGDIVFNAVHVSESPACVEKVNNIFLQVFLL